MEAKHLSTDELESGLPQIKQSPKESGELQLIARRPAIGERDLIDEGELDNINYTKDLCAYDTP